MAIPALSAVSTIGTCVSGTPDVSLPGAEAADTCGALNFCQPPEVTALSINEQVPHTAHVAEAEGRRPYLRGQHEVLTILWQTSKIHVSIQIKDLTAFISRKRDALAVH